MGIDAEPANNEHPEANGEDNNQTTSPLLSRQHSAVLDQSRTSPLGGAWPSTRSYNPHSARGTAAAHITRFRALALFGRRPPDRVDRPSPRQPKTCTTADASTCNKNRGVAPSACSRS